MIHQDYLLYKIQELPSLPNAEVRLFISISKSLQSMFKDFKNIVASNHDKIIVVDGKTAIIAPVIKHSNIHPRPGSERSGAPRGIYSNVLTILSPEQY